MKQYNSIKDIDTTTDDGKLLLATISQLSGEGKYTKMHPDEILKKMEKVARKIYADVNRKELI